MKAIIGLNLFVVNLPKKTKKTEGEPRSRRGEPRVFSSDRRAFVLIKWSDVGVANNSNIASQYIRAPATDARGPV